MVHGVIGEADGILSAVGEGGGVAVGVIAKASQALVWELGV